MQAPEYLHFFSWVSRVSLELPVGFEFMGEDPSLNVVTYADEREEEDRLGGRVVVKATALPGNEPGAHRKLAEATLRMPGRELLWKEEREVDDLPASVFAFRYRQPELGYELVRHETLIQAAEVLFTISSGSTVAEFEAYLPGFEHASRTARIILL